MNSRGTAGAANTGGGGGGSYSNSDDGFAGGNGGSGIVILRYPSVFTLAGGAGLTFQTYTSGLFKYTKFTAGTGTVNFQS
jgi:hypothetical protein